MNISVHLDVDAPLEAVWAVVCDIENCPATLNSVLAVEVIERPSQGFVGFKWKETRMMFGKEASETMWITEAEDNSYYSTRAESHGSVYKTRISLEALTEKTRLTMTFTAEPQTLMAKLLSWTMGCLFTGSAKKEFLKDLEDIRRKLENT